MKTKLLFILLLSSVLGWGQASLPVSTDALSSTALPTGFTASGLGTNYTTPCATALRLDNDGDYVQLYFSGTPGVLTYQLKGNVGSGSWQGVFTIEESANGSSWSVLRTINTTGAISTASTGTTFTDNPLAATRYIRWTYTTKTNGNVGMCNVDLTAGVTDEVDWCNLQHPANGSIMVGDTFNVYAKAYEPGVTPTAGAQSSISCWIGYSASNNNPNSSGWTWILASYSSQVSNDDEYVLNLGASLPAGTYYYASRFQYNGGPYKYGGYNGGFWDGTTNVNGVVTVTPYEVDWCNLQHPQSGSIIEGGTYNVYAKVNEAGVTSNAGASSLINAWIGYSTTNNNPNSAGWTWVAATFNTQYVNDDEYMANIGTLLTEGTYYYASRFQYNGGPYKYGGYNGGFWDGTTNVNGVLTVTKPLITVTPTTLTGFTYFLGSGPSAEQTFTISGSSLVANINITAPTNYEISTTSGSGFGSSIILTPSSGSVANTTIYVRLKAGLSTGNYNSEIITASSTSATNKTVTCSGNVTTSNNSDIFAVSGSAAASVSSIINHNAPLTSTTGVQVWQFYVRDGGATLNDADNLPTILTAFNIAQGSGNDVGTWSDAINTVALFDGSTFIATGTVTANQIQFSGLNISVSDNAQKLLSLRLSLKCPLGADAFDGEDIVFSISNANTTFSTSGSGKTTFSAQTTPNLTNTISVVATQIQYVAQPTTTGVGTTMSPNVVVKATDSCGNTDLGFSGNISLTSTGTMTGSPLTVTASSGEATFTNIIHTVIGTGYTMSASATGLASATSSVFDITPVTTLEPGDLAILAVNTAAESSGSADEISFVCFQDLLPGTTIYLTDNGYERVTAGLWGDTEGIISVTRTTSTLTKGTIITIHTTNGGVNEASDFTIYTCGAVDSNWSKGVVSHSSYSFDLNKNDQVWITQGGTWTDPNPTTANHNITYTGGNVLYGWTDIPWETAPGYASTQGSTIYPQRECYTTDVANPITGYSQVKFNDPVNPDFSTTTRTRLDWIALINNPANWDYYTSDSNYDAGGYDYLGNTTCPAMTIAIGTGQAGLWTGKKDTNWFDCANWDTLIVPDQTVDVTIPDTSYNNQAIVDATATYADYYNYIATTKNLTISGEKVEVVGDVNNKLEVYGNLEINGTGSLDMNDGNSSTADGQLYLYGNWTNTLGNSSFDEGNGTVHFTGTSAQIINAVTPLGTEVFYNVILNNNFDTAVSNDLVAEGNLTINATKNVNIDANGYIRVNNKLTHNGNLFIDNNGQFIQVEETDTNDGVYTGTVFQVKRTASARNLDYIYWGSPTENFAVGNLPNSHRYEWNTLFNNTNGTQGNWTAASGNMVKGKGYIARASNGSATPIPVNLTFAGKPHNGTFTKEILRGSFQGTDYDAEPSNLNNTLTTKWDDNWNLLSNPYPSAIKAYDFLNDNSNIQGFVKIWSHGTLPTSSVDPFYQDFSYNYTSDDYITFNGTGSVPPGYNGYIPSGQGFMVCMNDGDTASENVTFSNSMRYDAATDLPHNNTQFYRNNQANTNIEDLEKNRIWLDAVSTSTGALYRTLVGYVENATNDIDRLFDAVIQPGNRLMLYSLVDDTNDQEFTIQGRSLPFNVNDRVPMGIAIPSAGNYSIAIASVDGLFANNAQNIYIEDKELNVIHNLLNNPYSFYAEQGDFKNRFVLRYTTETLSNDEFNNLNNSVTVFSNNNINVKSSSEKIHSISVYDVLGKELFHQNSINSNEFSISKIQRTNSALIVKVVLENRRISNKKIIF